ATDCKNEASFAACKRSMPRLLASATSTPCFTDHGRGRCHLAAVGFHRETKRTKLKFSRRTIVVRAKLQFPVHPHMLRHGCGYALANAGHDTRALQAWLGHKNIQHTVRAGRGLSFSTAFRVVAVAFLVACQAPSPETRYVTRLRGFKMRPRKYSEMP